MPRSLTERCISLSTGPMGRDIGGSYEQTQNPNDDDIFRQPCAVPASPLAPLTGGTMSKPLRFLPQQCEDVKRGRKTMTRRPVELQSWIGTADEISWVHGHGHSGPGWYSYVTEYPDEGALFYECPYGQVGDTAPLLQPNDHEFAKGLITSIGVERVQEISEADCIAEGCPPKYLSGRGWYYPLWNSIYADKGLGVAENPWTWVIGFEVVG